MWKTTWFAKIHIPTLCWLLTSANDAATITFPPWAPCLAAGENKKKTGDGQMLWTAKVCFLKEQFHIHRYEKEKKFCPHRSSSGSNNSSGELKFCNSGKGHSDFVPVLFLDWFNIAEKWQPHQKNSCQYWSVFYLATEGVIGRGCVIAHTRNSSRFSFSFGLYWPMCMPVLKWNQFRTMNKPMKLVHVSNCRPPGAQFG